ncbi:hypothetical protein NDU88_008099 [Pleurodeles waltl]|uniref:Uncharacterized protein n=1 Tax=Pleurodeles waltl TaxID=8319 RepID=A0AAV7U236_PLEWA|nr:hypothetical protein NDU88_008099 [Pleurodeles waltl]
MLLLRGLVRRYSFLLLGSGRFAAAVFSARVLRLNAVPVSGFLPKCRWAGPLVGSLRLGRLLLQKHVLCFRVPASLGERCSDDGAVSMVCRRVSVAPSVVVSAAASTLLSSELEAPSREEQKGKYISKEFLPPLVKHVKMNMDFPDMDVPDTSGSLLRQFQSSVPRDVPVHPCIQEVIKREWRDPNKILLPRFMGELYPLQNIPQVLPDSVPIDSFATSLVGRTSLAKDAVIRDSVDRKVDVSLRKSYAGTHLA